MSIPKFLVFIGISLVLIGIFWQFGEKLGLGRLPGDLTWKGERWTVHFPLMTSIIVSVVLTLILWIIQIMRR